MTTQDETRMEDQVNPDEIKLEMTCPACPEQYDARYRGALVGYLRLRHGVFYVAVPDVMGDIIFEAETEGDGEFYGHERHGYLAQARAAIAAHYGGTR